MMMMNDYDDYDVRSTESNFAVVVLMMLGNTEEITEVIKRVGKAPGRLSERSHLSYILGYIVIGPILLRPIF